MGYPNPSHRRIVGGIKYLLLLAVGGTLVASPSMVRGDIEQRTVPTALYHAAFAPYYEGQYKDALDMFTEEWRRGIKTPTSRWIDSICYCTMMGECYYQMGQLEQALDRYTEAINLFLAFPDWMLRVRFPPELRPQSAVGFRQIPWGPSARRAPIAHIPTPMLIGQGQFNANTVVRQGGVLQSPLLFPIEAQEIVRATAQAIRRRTELLGPVGRHDPLTAALIAKVSQPIGPPNHWSQAWADLLRGLALAAGGKDTEAASALTRSLVAGGQFDHNLTAMGLFELGRLELVRANYSGAIKFFHEASISAAYFEDFGLLEEAFRCGSLSYLLANRKGVYPPLVPAAQWARANFRQLRVSLHLCVAEHQATMGLTRDAAARLDEAQTLIGRRTMGGGRIGARLSHLRALVWYQQKRVPAGDEALLAAMGYMRHGSLRLFHIAAVDARLASLPSRTAMSLFQEVLRDPQPTDWALDPLESLAVLMTPHPLPFERWFVIAMQRQAHDPELAMEVAERIRRHRFFTSLTFGGRLQALRWILEAPPEALDQQAKLQRQDLLADYPAFSQFSQEAAKLRAKLKQMPLVARDPATFQAQSKLLGQLAAIADEQEIVLRQMAVRRGASNLVFPPLRTLKEIQKGLPPGQAVLAFLVAGGELHGFLLNRDKYRTWTVKGAAGLPRRIAGLLREMGHYEQNRELTLDELTDTAWKQSARQVLDALLDSSGADLSKSFPELVIVPDGLLWYVPFEALQVNVDKRLHPLIARFRIRYAPTVSLAIPDERGREPMAPTAVVLGRLFPRTDESVAQAAFANLAKSVPGAVALGRPPLPAPSAVYASLMDRLIVLDDLVNTEDAYAWCPIQIDRGKPGNTLGDWLALPFRGPDIVILPGYHTAAENSLKRPSRGAPGAEVFLSVCGLMSSGARTILLSRWRTGGQTAVDLVREFAQELPHATAADAWQRAVLLVADTRLSPDQEPRIKRAPAEDPPKAGHPFFWAGYLLVDSGTPPQKEEPAAEKPEPKKAEKPALPPKQIPEDGDAKESPAKAEKADKKADKGEKP